jgi:hypothetical protein
MAKRFITLTPKSPRLPFQSSKMTASSSSTSTLECSTTLMSQSNYPLKLKYPNRKTKVGASMCQWFLIHLAPMTSKSSSRCLIKKIKKLTLNGSSHLKITNLPRTGSKWFKTTKTKKYNKQRKQKKTKKKPYPTNSNPNNSLSIKRGFTIL